MKNRGFAYFHPRRDITSVQWIRTPMGNVWQDRGIRSQKRRKINWLGNLMDSESTYHGGIQFIPFYH